MTAYDVEREKNDQHTIGIQVKTGECTTLTHLRLAYDEADQPGGVFPPGVHMDIGTPQFPSWEGSGVGSLPASSTATLPFTIWADSSSADSATLYLRVTSNECDEGACPEQGRRGWKTIVVNATFYDPAPPQPQLVVSPDYVETGVAYDESVTETVTLENRGDGDLEDVSLALLADLSGIPAPDWVRLLSSSALGVIPAGETREIQLRFQPTAVVPEGEHTAYLRVTSANAQTVDLGLYTTVTQSGIGNVLLKLSDIYTGTLNDQGQMIQGIAGARVSIQNETVASIAYSGYTDPVGELLIEDLPTGRYRCRITANNHQEYSGRFWIKAGLTTTQEVFLEYNLVTVEWEVTEITIEDRYEITLQTTFATDVPAAVVVAEPASATVPYMQPGDVYYGEFDLMNYGLIRADNLTILFPEDDQDYAYELLGGLPTSLRAKERITVPYRVTRLQAGQGDGDGSGGGSGCQKITCAVIISEYICANGKKSTIEIRYCLSVQTCEGTASGYEDFVYQLPPIDVPDDTIKDVEEDDDLEPGSYHPPVKPSSSSGWLEIKGPDCYPEAEGDECWSENICQRPQTCHNTSTETGSLVNNLTRQYSATGPVLAVKIPGGTLRVFIRYTDGQWLIEPVRSGMDGVPVEASGLSFHYYGDAIKGQVLTGMIKDGNLAYNLPEENFALQTEYDADGNLVKQWYAYTGEQMYLHQKPPYKIVASAGGYLWKGTSGAWKRYDAQGRLLSSGGRYGTTVSTLYDTEGNVAGYADRDGTQVIWFDYNADGRIEAVRDAGGRQLSYTYDSNGRLWTAMDVLNKETTYSYDDQGWLTKVAKPGGRESNITYDISGNVVAVTDEEGQGYTFAYDYDKHKDEYYTMITSPSGRIKEVWYDEDGRTKRIDINGETVQAIVKEDNALLITDKDGEQIRKEYDEWGNLTKVVYPDGSEKSYEYEHTHHRQIKAVDTDGTVTRYEYDGATGHLSREIKAAGTAEERITEYTHTPDDRLETITEKGDGTTPDAVTTYEYEAGYLVKITKPDGSTIEKTYDARGNVKTWKDQDGEREYTYDDEGRLISYTMISPPEEP